MPQTGPGRAGSQGVPNKPLVSPAQHLEPGTPDHQPSWKEKQNREKHAQKKNAMEHNVLRTYPPCALSLNDHASKDQKAEKETERKQYGKCPGGRPS